MSKTSTSSTTKISTFVVMIILVTLVLSFTALILAFNAFSYGQDTVIAGYLALIGILGVALSTYVLFQTRRRVLGLRIEAPPTTTTIECGKCGFKSIREFQRGDYIFKEAEPCQKCKDKMLVTAIYREVKEKKK